MNLLIKLQNGEPVDHPITVENARQCWPSINLENLPNNFAWFERVPRPILGPYDKNTTVSYQFVDGIVKDVWTTEKMTEEEKVEYQNKVKQSWYETTGYNSWIFNEEFCRFDPPIPYPTGGEKYDWDETIGNWVRIT